MLLVFGKEYPFTQTLAISIKENLRKSFAKRIVEQLIIFPSPPTYDRCGNTEQEFLLFR